VPRDGRNQASSCRWCSLRTVPPDAVTIEPRARWPRTTCRLRPGISRDIPRLGDTVHLRLFAAALPTLDVSDEAVHKVDVTELDGRIVAGADRGPETPPAQAPHPRRGSVLTARPHRRREASWSETAFPEPVKGEARTLVWSMRGPIAADGAGERFRENAPVLVRSIALASPRYEVDRRVAPLGGNGADRASAVAGLCCGALGPSCFRSERLSKA
jgi:hypothetical protein